MPLRGDVRFDHVAFGYDARKTILHDISLFAKPGQKIAFVGSTGAGKTTITSLVNRFYEIQSGTITYDGIDVRNIQKDSLRRSLGVVLQDTHLFTDTVADNIRYGRLDATEEEVEAAARLAGADSFIRHLPQGYQTMLSGEGGSLSQGERQLLNIARAACANPPVLILDEATSSIDTRTEKVHRKGHGSPDGGAHGVRHCPPTLHRPQCPGHSWCWSRGASSSGAATRSCWRSTGATISSTPVRRSCRKENCKKPPLRALHAGAAFICLSAVEEIQQPGKVADFQIGDAVCNQAGTGEVEAVHIRNGSCPGEPCCPAGWKIRFPRRP